MKEEYFPAKSDPHNDAGITVQVIPRMVYNTVWYDVYGVPPADDARYPADNNGGRVRTFPGKYFVEKWCKERGYKAVYINERMV